MGLVRRGLPFSMLDEVANAAGVGRIAMAYQLMQGDGEAARRWLQERHELIEGESPLERASTDVGGREVEQLIRRLRHGTFS